MYGSVEDEPPVFSELGDIPSQSPPVAELELSMPSPYTTSEPG